MKRLIACVAIAMALLFSGCASGPRQGMIMARFQAVTTREPPKAADLFGPGEVPSAYVWGYDDQTVTIEIFEQSTGKLVKKQTSFIPRGKDYYWILSDLPPGSYKAVISAGGTTRETRLFSIRM